MADRLLYRSGGVTVEIDDIASDLIRRVIDNAAPMLRDRIERAAEDVTDQAEREWPVGRRDEEYLTHNPRDRGKPHSRDQFRTEIVLESSGSGIKITGRIWNDADYWRFIRPKKLTRGTAINAYIRKPLAAERDRIRDELDHLMPEALRG